MDRNIAKVHFVGVGGVGMSGIASVAKKLGMQVTGSDLKESKYSKALKRQGIKVSVGHDARNITDSDPDVVVVSSAIPETNPEVVAARAAGIEIWPRAKMLAYVGNGYKVLAVAGTHGKTTTSSMLSAALVELGADPAFLVGGIIDGFDSNARYGGGEYCAVEADESDGSFTYLDPYMAIVTNIEADHLDHYGDLESIRKAFAEFVSNIPGEGCVIACGDNEGLVELMRASTEAPVVSYGIGEGCDVRTVPADDGSFDIIAADGSRATMRLQSNPGVHNMLNATSVVALLMRLGYGLDESVRAVESFSGVRRRFDLVGTAKGVTVIDDYGHHPTEIKATLAAARNQGAKRIHVLFQPHRYSRTASLADEFATAFDGVDKVTVMDVYSAGETPIPGITGKTVVDSVLRHDPAMDISWVQGRAEVVSYLADWLEEGDMLITMGAGDVTAIGPMVLEALESAGE
ncbi:MAG: UDP-N-acetylmuramate--L-alanine ligase [Coriobacteriales bacterium]